MKLSARHIVGTQVASAFRSILSPKRVAVRRMLTWLQRASDGASERWASVALFHATSGFCYARQKQWQAAIAAYGRATACHPTKPAYHYALARIYIRQKAWWKARESLLAAVNLAPQRAMWHFRLGEANDGLRRFADAADSYRQAVRLRPDRPEWHYRLGLALERSLRPTEAREAFAVALKDFRRPSTQSLGVGHLHERAQQWQFAARAYEAQLSEAPDDPELHFHLGLALERMYRWPEAMASYERALELDGACGEWHYRLGLIAERTEQLQSAVTSYRSAVALLPAGAPAHAEAAYRLGFVLSGLHRYEEASEAFSTVNPSALPTCADPFRLRAGKLRTGPRGSRAEQRVLASAPSLTYLSGLLATDATNAASHYLLGEYYRGRENWQAAAEAYGAAVERNGTHQPLWYFRFGQAQLGARDCRKACDAFIEMHPFRRPHGVPYQTVSGRPNQWRAAQYAEYFDCLHVQDRIALYESFHGASVSGNPYALLRCALSDPRLKHWTHVVVINDPGRVPVGLKTLRNVILVQRDCDLYLRYLCTAKVLINNNTFPDYFQRRPEQTYLNTWHGTPLKRLGKSSLSGFMEHGNATRNFLQSNVIISPNPHTTDVLLRDFDLESNYVGSIAATGYPRLDLTLGATAASRAELRARLGIPDASRVILYAPTYRGPSTQRASTDFKRTVDVLRALSGQGRSVLYRGHHLAEERIGAAKARQYLVPPGIDTNELLAITDVLVTDYSSVMFDFMATGRPIVYYAYDEAKYCRERGTYFSLSSLPGPVCQDLGSVENAVRGALDTSVTADDERDEARRKYCPWDDGHACERVVDLAFFPESDKSAARVSSGKPNLVLYGGAFIPNGIANSLINLLTGLAPEECSVSVMVDPTSVARSESRLAQLRRLPPWVSVIARVGAMTSSLEETWVVDQVHREDGANSQDIWQCYLRAFRREGRRLFGPQHRFDVLVCFEGYQPYWAALMGTLPGEKARRVCYQHNDMVRELESRFPYLGITFRTYELYDVLVSVSASTAKLNAANLASMLNVPHEHFQYCDNLQSNGSLASLAQAPISDRHARLLRKPGTKFVTMGRLSPEKGHEKLIWAFAAVHRIHPDTTLLVLGDGHLYHRLGQTIASLGLQESVILLGWQSNPFPYLALADCFVFASEYEGQGLVLIEAMRLGLPIVCTDFPCARDVLVDDNGLVVENTQLGLEEGMREFLAGHVRPPEFDLSKYQERALEQFRTQVLGNS